MTLQELINEYKEQAIICSKINYSQKKSINANNITIKRMYEIVDSINYQFGTEGAEEFTKLYDMKDYNLNVLSATHSLEKMNLGREEKEKALDIIKEVAKHNDTQGLGFKRWLKDYEAKNKK